jgi:dTDP-4-amino-4,6-dideoxygalactose transaminase
MKVPLLDLRAQHESLRVELLAAMERVIETVALPCFPELTEGQQQYVVDAISSFQVSGSSTTRLAHRF